MTPRWYFRWRRWWRYRATFSPDELGIFTCRVHRSGWYLAMNHYGTYLIIPCPGGFWWGLRQYKVRQRHDDFSPDQNSAPEQNN